MILELTRESVLVLLDKNKVTPGYAIDTIAETWIPLFLDVYFRENIIRIITDA